MEFAISNNCREQLSAVFLVIIIFQKNGSLHLGDHQVGGWVLFISVVYIHVLVPCHFLFCSLDFLQKNMSKFA